MKHIIWIYSMFLCVYSTTANSETTDEIRDTLDDLLHKTESVQQYLKDLEPLGLFATHVSNPTGLPCGAAADGWIELNAMKCIKIYTSSPTTLDKAKELCSTSYKSGFDIEVPRVLELNSEEEETALISLIYNTSLSSGLGVWLGARRLPGRHSDIFVWSSNKVVSYSNWGRNFPSRHSNLECVQLKADGSFGQNNVVWQDVLCNNANAVVCEKAIPMTFRDVVLALRKLQADGTPHFEEMAAPTPTQSALARYEEDPNFPLRRLALDINGTGIYFISKTVEVSWQDAKRSCALYDMKLAEFHILAELERVVRFANEIGSTDSFWVGAVQLNSGGGNWSWDSNNGTIAKEFFIAGGETVIRSFMQEMSLCSRLSITSKGLFAYYCSRKAKYICKFG